MSKVFRISLRILICSIFVVVLVGMVLYTGRCVEILGIFFFVCIFFSK